MAAIELASPITRQTVEQIHARAGYLQKRGSSSEAQRFLAKGLRAARARDPRLLMALEKAAEIMTRLQEEQMGRTQRDASTTFADRSAPVEVSLWREAYKAADAGQPPEQLGYIYGAAAELAGY